MIYDRDLFDPPAPVAYVVLRDTNTGRSLRNVSMLIDSGADVTLIPKEAVASLGMQFDQDIGYEVVGFDGTKSIAPVVTLDLALLGRVFEGRYLGCDQSWGILGRDVLNHLTIVLDGPDQAWHEAAE